MEGYDKESTFNSKVKNKVFLLDNPTKDSKDAKDKAKQKKKAKKTKALNAREKRQLQVYEIPLEARKYVLFTGISMTNWTTLQPGTFSHTPLNLSVLLRYDYFLPLHELWESYINELYGGSTPMVFAQKLLKADFHGAKVTGNPTTLWSMLEHSLV